MKKCASFIETRIGYNYIDSINNHLRHLRDWDFFVLTTKKSWNSFYNCLNLKFKRINEIKDSNDYNKMLTSFDFWNFFVKKKYDRVLICQHDSGLLLNNIDDYLEYDYVGSPWDFQEHGGNGGLSLRNPKVMMEICSNFLFDKSYFNEDIFFCDVMYKEKIGNLAPREVCKKFSMEVILELNTTGYHGIEKYHHPDTVDKIKSQEIISSKL